VGGDAVYRGLAAESADDWRALVASGLAHDPRIVATEEVGPGRDGWSLLLRHERVPFVSYPYEWPFSLLKRAALLQLDLLSAAVEADLMLKDGTPYNVQFRGAEPVFIDIGSFERLREGEPWAGYRQFCQQQLYPLMLQAFRDVPYQPWLRGALEGIAPAELRNLLRLRDRLRKGVTTHVVLHARLERRYADRSREVKSELRRAGFRKELVLANARGLRKVVERLEWRGTSAAWGGYGASNSYSDGDARAKAAFVDAAARQVRPRLVWDLGCNDGTYAKVAAESAATVVAMDGDQPVIDRLARELAAAGNTVVLPLVVDLADPSPDRGWRGVERRSLAERGTPDLTLALALVHHLAITRNIPLAELLDWLAELGTSLVVEWVDPADPLARRLLDAKRDGLHADYTREVWERLLGERFDVERTQELTGGSRTLYLAHPRR
jgi:ribosomal protein L11 methylase PrmA